MTVELRDLRYRFTILETRVGALENRFSAIENRFATQEERMSAMLAVIINIARRVGVEELGYGDEEA